MFMFALRPTKPSIKGTEYEWLNEFTTIIITPPGDDADAFNLLDTLKKSDNNSTSPPVTTTTATVTPSEDSTVQKEAKEKQDHSNSSYSKFKSTCLLQNDIPFFIKILQRNDIKFINGKMIRQLSTQHCDLNPSYSNTIEIAQKQSDRFDLEKDMIIINLPQAVGFKLFEIAQDVAILPCMFNIKFKSQIEFEVVKLRKDKNCDKFFLKGFFNKEHKACLEIAVKQINNNKLKLVVDQEQKPILLLTIDDEFESILDSLMEILPDVGPRIENKSTNSMSAK